ncbi:MAG: guanylate kinase, partial [Patescibacteria group bacterium]
METAKQILVIAGPTGSGESTITNEIVKRYPHKVVRLVTSTTREPRRGEQNGIDYFFFTKEQFAAARAAGELLEETYVENRDTYYGTYKPDLDEKLSRGFIVIFNPDLKGAKFYKERYNATTVFVKPGSVEELQGRLAKRNPEMSEQEHALRKENALREMTEEGEYDYSVTNANGQLERAVDEVDQI